MRRVLLWVCVAAGACAASVSQVSSTRRSPDLRPNALTCFVGGGGPALLGSARRVSGSVCMVEDKPMYGAASDYLKKVPPNLRGLAIRNVNKDTFNVPKEKIEYIGDGRIPTVEEIQAELDAEEDEEFDEALEILELEDIDVSKFSGDLDDAAILKDLKSKNHPDDFRMMFKGRSVGDLL